MLSACLCQKQGVSHLQRLPSLLTQFAMKDVPYRKRYFSRCCLQAFPARLHFNRVVSSDAL